MICAPHEAIHERKLTDWERSFLITVQTDANEEKGFAEYFRLLLLSVAPMKTPGEVQEFLDSARETFGESVSQGTSP